LEIWDIGSVELEVCLLPLFWVWGTSLRVRGYYTLLEYCEKGKGERRKGVMRSV